MINRFLRWWTSKSAWDVYDIRAFYVLEAEVVESPFGWGYYCVKVRMADSTPSSGMSRYDDPDYDYFIKASYKGEAHMTLDVANKAQKILLKKRSFAHSDL